MENLPAKGALVGARTYRYPATKAGVFPTYFLSTWGKYDHKRTGKSRWVG
jgi:hypothetical protein